MSERTGAGDFVDLAGNGTVLCAASAYDKKYYFNRQFAALPEDIQKEVRTICILFTQDIGGYFLMTFSEEGHLQFKTSSRASDYSYDEIGAVMMVRQIQKHRQRLLSQLELFYRIVFPGMNEDIDN